VKRKIAFVCNWGNSSAELLAFLVRQTPGGRGVWENLEGVASPAEADFVVVLEDLPSSTRRSDLDLERTIFLPREPAAVRARKNYESLRAPLAFTHDDIHQAAVWRIMRPFEELAAPAYGGKSRPLSSVTSAASQTPGHRVRTRFLRDFARRHPGVLDVYGYGWKGELGDAYKGEIGNRFAKITDLPALCKSAGLAEYRYSLAFENSRQKNYFSEKALDCWLAWSMPIYWGCPNLADYFPEDSFHAIDPSSGDCVDRVAEIVARPIGDRQIAAMAEARRRILQRYNIWATVHDIIVGGRRPQPVAPPSLWRRMVALVKNA
jgi:hypothetical protein